MMKQRLVRLCLGFSLVTSLSLSLAPAWSQTEAPASAPPSNLSVQEQALIAAPNQDNPATAPGSNLTDPGANPNAPPPIQTDEVSAQSLSQAGSQAGNQAGQPLDATQSSNQTSVQTDSPSTQAVDPAQAAQQNQQPSSSLYRSQWAQDSISVLQENGIQLPQGINYSALISQHDFINLLAQISSMPQEKLNTLRLPAGAPVEGITRGEAIHLVLGSFGLTESLPGFAKQPSKFSDLPNTHPAYASVVLAESVHLINGYPDHTIRPDERLSWGEALILVETVYSWRKALPTTAPEWVKNYQQRQNMWYQLIDGFRLLLTLAYMGLALYFLTRTWLKVRKQKHSPYRNFSFGLSLLTVLLGLLWISELLFNYSLIPREVYASLAMLSVFAGLFLLKLGSDIDSDISKPKPQVVIDAGYVTSINHEKGEIFIRDKITDSHSLALVGSDTKVLRKTGKKSVESAFLSDVQIGDVISVRGSRLEHESLMQVERLTLVEQAQQQQTETSQQAIREYVQAPQQQQQQQVNRIVRN